MLKVQTFQELTGTQYLQADIACKHDKSFEKKPWMDRVNQFSTLNLDDPSIYKTASNPVGLRAAILNYKKAEQGEGIGYMCSFDAASSGLQLLSLLISDPLSFKLCGGDENILDAYTELFMHMNPSIQVERKDVKQAIMTAFYGSKVTPLDVFGENIDVFYETLEKMAPGAWETNLEIQELWNMVDETYYQWYLPDGFFCHIDTEDKERVPFKFLDEEYSVVQTVNQKPKFHKGLGPNMIHSVDGMIVREMFRRCMHDPVQIYGRIVPLITNDKIKGGTSGKSAERLNELWSYYKETGFLSTRIFDFIYEDTLGIIEDRLAVAKLIQSLPAKPFDLVSVHDCFRCHPNYGNDVRRQYNHILADINDSTIMEFMAQQIVEDPRLQVVKTGRISRDVILNANYTLS